MARRGILPISQAEDGVQDENRTTVPIDNEHVQGNAFSFATLLYAVFIIVFVIVAHSSNKVAPENSRDFRGCTVLSLYLYTVGIGFLVYVNLFVIHTSWINRILGWLSSCGAWLNAKNYRVTPATHDGKAVNSLFLRFGVGLFGSAGAVMHSLLLYLLLTNQIQDTHVLSAVIEAVICLIFTFLQMYFMNVNYKLLITTSRTICRFGFMHLLAVNVWTWFRFVTAKYHESILKHAEKNANKTKEIETTEQVASSFPIYVPHEPDDPAVIAGVEILGMLKQFDDFAVLLATCLIEYSVIGAAVMFIFWKQVDAPSRAPRKQRLRVDFRLVQITIFYFIFDLRKMKRNHEFYYFACSYTLSGIYAGIVISIIGVTVAAIFAAMENENRTALFGAFDSLCYVLSIAAVIAAACLMRSMDVSASNHGDDVDEILLYVAFVGEVIWNCAELANFITGDVGAARGAIILAITLLRLVHVVSQTWFILAASRMRFGSSMSALRGRVPVTFLLTVNIIMFFFGIYESMNDRFGVMNQLSSTQGYLKLAAAPIIVFYRFHCSVCLAEIWQKSFARPKDNDMISSPSSRSMLTITMD